MTESLIDKTERAIMLMETGWMDHYPLPCEEAARHLLKEVVAGMKQVCGSVGAHYKPKKDSPRTESAEPELTGESHGRMDVGCSQTLYLAIKGVIDAEIARCADDSAGRAYKLAVHNVWNGIEPLLIGNADRQREAEPDDAVMKVARAIQKEIWGERSVDYMAGFAHKRISLQAAIAAVNAINAINAYKEPGHE